MSIEAVFREPPIAARPMLRWWWPGGAVTLDSLCEQLRGFAAAGWGGVEIQPCRIGLPHDLPPAQAARVHEVFTPAWFELVAGVMDEAARLGLVVDVTFGSAWPFGGGEAITPELATRELTLAWTTVQGPRAWKGMPRQPERPLRNATWQAQHGGIDEAQALPPGWQQRIESLSEVVAVLALRGGTPSLGPFAGFVPMTLPDRWGQVLAAGWVDAAGAIDLTDQLQPDGSLQWDVPEGEWQIVVCRSFVSDQMILEGAGRGPQLVLDHLNRAAFDAHAARVGDAALPSWSKHAGKTWRSVFVDSLEIPADLLWTEDFLSEFRRRRGYELRPLLPLALQPGWRNCFQARQGAPLFDDAELGPRLRADYRLTVSELMIERLYAPLSGWAAEHGLQAKIQAHGAPADWLQAYGAAGIPETEDLVGGAAPHLLRMARSAAHIYGRRLVTGEAFCWLLEGLAVTPRQVRERADVFYAAGIQQLVGHGAAAPMSGWTGGHPWYPFEAMEIGTPLNDANPWWAMVRPLTDYMARNQALLQQGKAVVPVAVLAPPDLFAFNGAADRMTPPPWHEALQDAGYDWDWINDHGLLASRLEPGAIVTPGGHRYQAVMLPDLAALRAEVAEFLAACAEAGVTVRACGSASRREAGLLDAAERDLRVQRAMAGVKVVAPSALGRSLRAAGVPPSLDIEAGHGCAFHVREIDGDRWVLLNNPGPSERTLALADGRSAELWCCWSGEIRAVQGTLSLAPRSSRWIRTTARTPFGLSLSKPLPAEPSPRFRASGEARELPGPWQVRGRGVGLAGRTIEFDAQWQALTDVSQIAAFADFAGQLRYRLHFELSPEEQQSALRLDLGAAHDAVSLCLNGGPPLARSEGPFVFELPAALLSPLNTVEVTVANVPENAHRDPARPGGLPLPGRRLTRLPTGLLGPVRLLR